MEAFELTEFRPGEVLIAEGDVIDKAFFIMEGECRLIKKS